MAIDRIDWDKVIRSAHHHFVIGFCSVRTRLMKLVASAAELTRALELDKPAAGGMVPDTAANKPTFSPSFSSSKIPLTPHRK